MVSSEKKYLNSKSNIYTLNISKYSLFYLFFFFLSFSRLMIIFYVSWLTVIPIEILGAVHMYPIKSRSLLDAYNQDRI